MNPGDSHIDNLFREGLDSGTSGAWDSPSVDVWNGISEKLRDDRRRRRRFFWWLLGAGAIAAVVLAWILSGPPSEPGTSVPLATEMAGTPGAMTHNATESTAPQETQLLSGSVDTTPGQDGTRSTAPLQAQGNHDTQETEKYVDAIAQIRTSENSEGSEKNTTRSNIPVQQSGKADVAVSESRQTSPEPLLAQTEQPADPVLLSTLGTFARTKTELHPLAVEPTGISWERSLPVMNPFLFQNEIISVASRAGGWDLSLYGAPSWGTRHISVPREQPRIRRRLLLRHETPVVQVGFGAGIARSIAKHWSLSTGLEYSSFLLEGRQMHQVRFTRAGEHLNDRGNLENTLALNLNTSFGTVATDVVIERSTASQIDEHRFIDLELQTAHAMKMLQIPLSAEYETHLTGKWRVSVKTGVIMSMILKNTLDFRLVRSLDQEIRDARVAHTVSPAGARDILFGYHAGIGLHRPVADRWSVFVEPVVSGSFQSLYQGESVSVYPMLFDMHLGIKYQL